MNEPAFADPAGTWNKRFEGSDYLFGTEPNDYLRAHAGRLRPGGRVLCVADGEGRNSVWLAQRGMSVDAFDIAAVGVDKARRLAAAAGVNVHYEVADCEGWRWPVATYDAVVAIFVQFADPAMRERLFARIVSALAPGGMLLLQGYTPRQLEFRTGGPPILSHLYTAEMLRAAFGALEIVELREYVAELCEGSHHVGRSALVGMLARKP
ncbi:MAG TPA: class I SAM-dependent methyltransferase [Burkholderiaceae bacterium]|nr:class I SAM-dependent methyltransferase [Burkholderiaceae bacterium]